MHSSPGLTDFNVSEAYNQMRANALGPQPRDSRGNIESYIANGFVPLENDNRGTCDTLAYAYNDWAIAELARLIGRTEDVPTFSERALNYRNAFSPEDTFMCPRYLVRRWADGRGQSKRATDSDERARPGTGAAVAQNGTFLCPRFEQYSFSEYYVEGSAWYVPRTPAS